MVERFVLPGEIVVAERAAGRLKTPPLGADVAVLAFHADSGAAGLANIMLPDSRVDSKRAEIAPGLFADTAVIALVGQTMQTAGVRDAKTLRIGLVGGGRLLSGPGLFDVGARTLRAVKTQLSRAGLSIAFEDTGEPGNTSVSLDLATGALSVEAPGRESRERRP